MLHIIGRSISVRFLNQCSFILSLLAGNTIIDFNNGCEIVYAELDAAKSADAMSGGAVPRGLLPIAAARSGCATAISVSSGLTLFSSVMELTGGYV